MPPKKASAKTGTKDKVTKVAAPARNLRSRAVKSENPLPPPPSPAKPRSPAKSASPPKPKTKDVIRKATTKKTPKKIAKKPSTQNAGKKQGQRPEQVHSDAENTEQRFNHFWLNDGMQLQQMLEFVNRGAVTGLIETARELTKPYMQIADAPIPPIYDPSSPVFDPVSPESPQPPSTMPRKRTCGLKCCINGIVCQGAGCYPPEVSDEEWSRIIESPVDAEFVSCEMCRTILEAGIPTVVCLPRRLTVGCTCWSPLKTVIKMRGNGKSALNMAEPANKEAVARAKAAITSLYEQQTARYMAEARR